MYTSAVKRHFITRVITRQNHTLSGLVIQTTSVQIIMQRFDYTFFFLKLSKNDFVSLITLLEKTQKPILKF
jgi:hypothetical protein